MSDLDPNANIPPAPPRRGWLSRNWLWFIPLTLLLAVLLCGGCCGGILVTVFGAMKTSAPYQMALKQVQNDPQVIEKLGQPIKDGWIPSGEVNISNGSGDARLDFNVTGPKGTAHVHTEARRSNGVWTTTVLDVTIDSQRISLTPAGNSGIGEAPPFEP